jgi:hypothetical protein
MLLRQPSVGMHDGSQKSTVTGDYAVYLNHATLLPTIGAPAPPRDASVFVLQYHFQNGSESLSPVMRVAGLH